MKFFIAIIFFVLVNNLFAQNDSIVKHKIDSLNSKLVADSSYTYRFRKLRPFANVDSRTSFKPTNLTNLSGFQFGVIVNEYHTFGLGLYTLTKFSKKNSPLNAISEFKSFGYVNVFYEYFLLNRRFFEIDLPFEIGVGGFKGQLRDTVSNTLNISKLFVPLGAGVKFIVKPVRWFGISTMLGYRYIPYKQNLLDYAGLYYSLGIWADFRQIYRDVKYYGFQKRKYRKEVNALLLN